MAENLQCTCRQ